MHTISSYQPKVSVIDVYIERYEYDDFSSETDFIVEPTDHFREEYPLQMACTLVDINNACIGKVKSFNTVPYGCINHTSRCYRDGRGHRW